MFYKYIYLSKLQTISYYHIVTLFERKRFCVICTPLHTYRNTLSKAALILKKIQLLDFLFSYTVKPTFVSNFTFLPIREMSYNFDDRE
jgi:hypothetical protein